MSEKVISLISGGIDSPLATLIVAEEFEILPIHYCSYPMTSEENVTAVFETLETLNNKINFEKTLILPWAGILQKIQEKINEHLTCVACRKSMLITAEKIGEKENVSGIITGEALGQKASQTLENIQATSHQIKTPIIRPLIGMDKKEITQLSKEKGIWKKDHAGGCIATPDKPNTKTDPKVLKSELEKINLLDLIKEYEDLILELKEFSKDDFDSYLSKLATEFR